MAAWHVELQSCKHLCVPVCMCAYHPLLGQLITYQWHLKQWLQGPQSLPLGHATHQTAWVVVYSGLALIAHQIIGLMIRHGRLKGTYGFGQWPSKAARHIVVLQPQCLLAKQAEAYLAVISRSTVEDKISRGHYFPFSLQEWQAYYTVDGIYEMIIFDGLDVRRSL